MSDFRKKKIIETLLILIVIIVLFVCVFCATYFIFRDKSNSVEQTENPLVSTTEEISEVASVKTDTISEIISVAETSTTVANMEKITEETTKEPEWTGGILIEYPSDTDSWKLICLNKYRYVGSSVDNIISLSYVAGSSERMDTRAAEAYETMYAAAKDDGYTLTPCSGYRSYSTQKRLYLEFVYEYMSQGFSEQEAHNLASKRRNPPGSSEHNIGICMDIICAASSANFQNTQEYAWLCENAHLYGFILRYPEDKTDITGVKFEPWHWRYVGVENALNIKNSGLCLEEYLGFV